MALPKQMLSIKLADQWLDKFTAFSLAGISLTRGRLATQVNSFDLWIKLDGKHQTILSDIIHHLLPVEFALGRTFSSAITVKYGLMHGQERTSSEGQDSS